MPPTLCEYTPSLRLSTAEVLALEESLLLALNQSGLAPDAQPFMIFRETQSSAVILGTGQKHAEVVNRAACERDAVPILRRPSGGGCVFHMPGVLWFSLGVPFDWLPQGHAGGIRATFSDVLEPICAGLHRHWQIPATLQGICDIAVPADIPLAGSLEPPATTTLSAPTTWKKVAGSAQCRKQRAVLIHGTLLISADLTRMDPYLPLPEKQPAYRAGRPHREFLTTLEASHPLRNTHPVVSLPPICDAIARAWLEMLAPQATVAAGGGSLTRIVREPDSNQLAAARDLAREKYTADSWTFRL